MIHRILALLFVAGVLGMTGELFLLEHFEGWRQRIPLAALALGALSGIWILAAPGRGAIRCHRVAGLLLFVAGAAGYYFHLQGNSEFEQELYPSLAGAELFWKSMKGATPALAPFAMAHLGLLGLVSTFRHPKLATNTQETSQ